MVPTLRRRAVVVAGMEVAAAAAAAAASLLRHRTAVAVAAVGAPEAVEGSVRRLRHQISIVAMVVVVVAVPHRTPAPSFGTSRRHTRRCRRRRGAAAAVAAVVAVVDGSILAAEVRVDLILYQLTNRVIVPFFHLQN